MFNLNENKAIKEVSKTINKLTKKVRPVLNVLKLEGDKIYSTDSYKAFIVETEEKRDEITYFRNEDIIKANELSVIEGVTCEAFPDKIENFIPTDIEADTSFNVDYMIDILKVYQKAGAKEITLKLGKDNGPIVIEEYHGIKLKDGINKITALLMPLRKK